MVMSPPSSGTSRFSSEVRVRIGSAFGVLVQDAAKMVQIMIKLNKVLICFSFKISFYKVRFCIIKKQEKSKIKTETIRMHCFCFYIC